MAEACIASAGSCSQWLRLAESEQGEPMRMRVAGHQLCWAFADTLRNPAAEEYTVIEEELQQTQVVPSELTTQGEIVAQT